MKLYQNRTVTVQMISIISLFLLLGFSSIATLVYKNISQVLLERTLDEQQSRINALATTLASEFSIYLDNAQKLESTFQHAYLQGLTFEDRFVNFFGYQVKDASLNGLSMINNVTAIDNFYRDTGAISTLFLSAGDDFLRVATSLKNENGQRAMGTLLGKNHPGIKQLQQGRPYYAQVVLFAKNYLTYYAPIMNNRGQVAAVSFIGIPIGDATKNIFSNLTKIGWGDTGVSFVLAANEKNKGDYIYHPDQSKKGNALNYRALNNQKPFAEIFTKNQGVVRFESLEADSPQSRYFVYADVPGWQWKLVGGTKVSEITKESKALLISIITISFVIGLVTLIVISFFVRKTVSPLARLNQYMERLGDGEVSFSMGDTRPYSSNEVDKLMYGVSVMANKLSALVGGLRLTSDSLHQQSDSVANDADSSLGKSHQQQMEIEQVVSAIEEIAATAQASAQQIEEIASSVNMVKNDAGSGSLLVKEMTADITQLNNQLHQSTQAIDCVNEESRNIQSVTKIIDEIAEQTNLLALNAAIEAARAGEHGRGFAVVADEVRTLAARTRDSVKEVVTIIEQLQHSTRSAVEMMSQSEQRSAVVTSHATEVGSALENVARQVLMIAEQADAIAATSEEQASVTQEISSNASRISTLNSDNHHTAKQTAESATQLHKLSADLNQQVAYFS